jgi:hypothetical protein
VCQRVRLAVAGLPAHFQTDTRIEGISATDIFTLNAALGATIEDQLVATLNRVRATWDPEGRYSLYAFVRQPQTFPDVLLRGAPDKAGGKPDIVMGLELKGWYLLSKEREPSFRYTVTPAACAPADLLVCVPWALKNVLSGAPMVFEPYVEKAKYAAELRNYYWQHKRTTRGDAGIAPPPGPVAPYPNKSKQIGDVPRSDRGGNFGRYARTGIMDSYLTQALAQPLCGIAAGSWLDFFKLFTESASERAVAERIALLRRKMADATATADRSKADVYLQILDILEANL